MTNLPATSTTSASLSRNFGFWQDKAMTGPVLVTHHGRPRAVLVSAEAYEHMGDMDAASGANDTVSSDYDLIIDRMAEGLIVLDANLIILRVNRAAATYFKRSPGTMAGARLADLYPSLQETTKNRILNRVLRTGEAASFEAPSSIYPGQQLRIDAFPFGEGVAYLFQALPDEELRRQASESEALKALFLAHGASGTARLSTRGTFLAIDPSLLTMTDFAEGDLLAARLVDIVPVARRVELRAALEAVLNGNGAVAIPTEIMTRAGPELPVTIALSETREGFSIDGAAMLVTPRTPE